MPSVPRPASTVVIARPAASTFEVFLVRRQDAIAFMGGAHVFPGGRVDDGDFAVDARTWCDGVDVAAARLPLRAEQEAIAFHVAAARELFEEAGVLLARDPTGDPLAFNAENEQRFADAREALLRGEFALQQLAEREGLRLGLDLLAVFAHWVTPAVETRRFDTQFFFAIAPPRQRAAHDDREATHGAWMTPADAIERCRRGEVALPPPTWTTLRWLSRCATVEDAWQWAVAQRAPLVQPRIAERTDGTRVIMLPGDPECPPVAGFAAEETRFLLENGRWRPIDAG
jgi:8-oxo-dGTP pyrophosphatase MutT (NUDIX family)